MKLFRADLEHAGLELIDMGDWFEFSPLNRADNSNLRGVFHELERVGADMPDGATERMMGILMDAYNREIIVALIVK